MIEEKEANYYIGDYDSGIFWECPFCATHEDIYAEDDCPKCGAHLKVVAKSKSYKGGTVQ